MKFTDSHEWTDAENSGLVRIGITHYAQKELGDIVYVELPAAGKQVNAGQEIAVLESTKAAADIYSPVSGEIMEVNQNLSSNPELINRDPEGEGWILKVRPSNIAELDLLMDLPAYQAMLNGA